MNVDDEVKEWKSYLEKNAIFITKVIRLIKEQKAAMIEEHISYDQIEGRYDSSIFTTEKHASFDKAYRAQKHIQDYKKYVYMQSCRRGLQFQHR